MIQVKRIQHISSTYLLISLDTNLLKYQRPEKDPHLVVDPLHSLMWSVRSQIRTNCLQVF